MSEPQELEFEVKVRNPENSCDTGVIYQFVMIKILPDKDKEVYSKRRVPLRRYGDPEEVAHATLNFCLPSSSFITGAVLAVDGGLTIKRA